MKEPTQSPISKPPLKVRLMALLQEYGKVAIIIYFAIFALVMVGFALAIQFGFKTESTVQSAGTWAAAWVATKLTQPLRILATLVLTPVFGKLAQRVKRVGRPPPAT